VGIRDSHTRDAQAGVQLKSKATVSERRVHVTLDDGQTAEGCVANFAQEMLKEQLPLSVE
jgi:hypothetical protein